MSGMEIDAVDFPVLKIEPRKQLNPGFLVSKAIKINLHWMMRRLVVVVCQWILIEFLI